MIKTMIKNFSINDIAFMITLSYIAYMLFKLNKHKDHVIEYTSMSKEQPKAIPPSPSPKPQPKVPKEPPKEEVIKVIGYLKRIRKGTFTISSPEEAQYILYSDKAIALNMELPTSLNGAPTYRKYGFSECYDMYEGNARIQDPPAYSILEVMDLPIVQKISPDEWTIFQKGKLSIQTQ